MKLVNPRNQLMKLALGKVVVQADEKGIVDVPDEFAGALLKSGYMTLEAYNKIEEGARKSMSQEIKGIAAEALKAKAEMNGEEAGKKIAPPPPPKAPPVAPGEELGPNPEAGLDEPEIEEGGEAKSAEEAPKRGWKRRGK